MKGTILLVEDEQGSAATTVRGLLARYREKGYNVELAENPLEAIERVKSGGVAAVVADYDMRQAPQETLEGRLNTGSVPLRNGLEVLELIANMRPEVQRVLYTGQAGPDTAIEMTKTGIAPFVEKRPDGSLDGLFEVLDPRLDHYERTVRQEFGTGRGDNILVTGGTGFLMSAMIRKYLSDSDVTVWALARDSKSMSAEDRIMQKIAPEYQDRVRVVRGDLSARLNDKGQDINAYGMLDLKDPQVREMLAVVNQIDHGAAALNFEQDNAMNQHLEDTNVDGTRRVLQIASMLVRPLESFNYVSTFFVHGTRTGLFLEDEGQPTSWLNPYERSKWDSEAIVKDSGLPWRVFRPSIVMVEEGSPDVAHDTAYGIADVTAIGLKIYRKRDPDGTPIVYIAGDEDAVNNFVSRADVVDMMFGVWGSDHGMRHVYHTVGKNTPTREVFGAIGNLLGIDMQYVPRLPEGHTPNVIEKLYMRKVFPLFKGYLFKDAVEISQNNVISAIGPERVDQVARFDQEMLERNLREHYQKTGVL